jgi:hypothetical protein
MRAPGGSDTLASRPRSVVRDSFSDTGAPTACFAIARAAMMYWSRNDGDTLSALAMLSNPSLMSSLGSSAVTSTSSPNRSRIAFAYSARFNR